MKMKATICAAAAAGFLAMVAPGAAQAAVPADPGAAGATSGLLQNVAWHHRYHRHWGHRHRECWVTRRVHWRHGHRVVVRVRHCGWRW